MKHATQESSEEFRSSPFPYPAQAPALVALVALASALAAQNNEGFEGPSFSTAGTNQTPTAEKPESKLWRTAPGVWWGIVWANSATPPAFHIHRHQNQNPGFGPQPSHFWADTGVAVDSRADSHCDVLWDGTNLYIASHKFQADGNTSGNPIHFFRYSFNGGIYTQELQVQIGDVSTEAVVIDKDSEGRIWATWTQSQRVRVNWTMGITPSGHTNWHTMGVAIPMRLPNTTPVGSDDISSLIAFNETQGPAPGPRIGVLWSDQADPMMMNDFLYRFSIHPVGTDPMDPMNWSSVPEIAASTPGIKDADDHINLKTDNVTGRVFLAGKNDANQILLMVRSAPMAWVRHEVWQPADNFTRPIVLLQVDTQMIHVFGADRDTGEISKKMTSMNNPDFVTPGTIVVMRDASSDCINNGECINNPTSTKQNFTTASGLAVLAAHETSGLYWHHDQ